MPVYNFNSEQYSQLGGAVDYRSDQEQSQPQQSLYDHSNPDIGYAEATALENIRISGAWVTVLARTRDEKYNKVWMEDQDPTYYVGYDIKAFMPPAPPEVLLSKFGIDAPTNFELKFSRAELIKLMGERLIQTGDIIIIPHNSLILKAKRFRVLHAGETGNFKYRWIYLSVVVENVNKDTSFEPKVL